MTAEVYIIFEQRPSGSDHAESWWLSAAAVAGLEARILYATDLSVGCDSRGGLYVLNGAERLGNPRAVLMRCYNSAVSRTFEAMGVRVLNSTESMELCRDKFRCGAVLSAAGLPVPPSLLLSDSISAASIASVLGDPFIMKPNIGSKGENVRLIHVSGASRKERPEGHGMIAQTFIGSSRGRDIRVWVAGGEAVAAVVRSNPGSIVSNYAAGGTATAFGGPDRGAVFKLAEQAAAACGLFFAGVDILYGYDGQYIICEVNGNAGFRTLTLTGGPDLPAIVMQKLSAI